VKPGHSVTNEEEGIMAVDLITQASSLRANAAIEAAVERGLMAALLHGVQAGALLMVQEGVPLDVATRVLLYPQCRRSTDWRH
jgi:hypothetical protein